MQRLLKRFLLPMLLFAPPLIGQLPASTFGGSTGPRQSTEEDLPRISVDAELYRRTKARVWTDDCLCAPLNLPGKTYIVKKADEDLVEQNKIFVVIPKE